MTMILRRIMCATALLTMSLYAASQVETLPVTKVNGKIYHYYVVEGSESVYSLSHKLKIKKDDIVRHNPSASEGLKKGMMLYFPFDMTGVGEAASEKPAAPRADATAETAGTYTVAPGETIYGLAKRFGISEERLRMMNPQIGGVLKAGEKINVPSATKSAEIAEEKSATPEVTAAKSHLVADKETFYSIARMYGITVAELEAANPTVTIPQKGQVLNIPEKDVAPIAEDVTPAVTVTEDAVIADDKDAKVSTEISVAVILPFMLHQDSPSKSALRFTEFYKGFLMAADSLRSTGKTINIRAYDCASSMDTLKAILNDPALPTMDIIVAPDNSAELAMIAKWGKENDVKVLNSFVVKDNTYLTNEAMIQAIIPSETMYGKAAQSFIATMGDYTPVIVSRNETTADKPELIAEVRTRLAQKGIVPVEIKFDNRLTPADLAGLDVMGNYIFLPVTGRQNEVSKILPGIEQWRQHSVTPGVKVFGYPEWTLFKGETLKDMHALNTTVYSRFYLNEESYRTRSAERTFTRWYGTDMENASPRQGLLGFDTGMFVLRLLMLDSNDPAGFRYSGIQNDFNFKKVPAGGWVNQSLSLINYRPDGTTDKTACDAY